MQEVCIIRIAVVVDDQRGPVPHLQHAWDPCRMRASAQVGSCWGPGPRLGGSGWGQPLPHDRAYLFMVSPTVVLRALLTTDDPNLPTRPSPVLNNSFNPDPSRNLTGTESVGPCTHRRPFSPLPSPPAQPVAFAMDYVEQRMAQEAQRAAQ